MLPEYHASGTLCYILIYLKREISDSLSSVLSYSIAFVYNVQESSSTGVHKFHIPGVEFAVYCYRPQQLLHNTRRAQWQVRNQGQDDDLSERDVAVYHAKNICANCISLLWQSMNDS